MLTHMEMWALRGQLQQVISTAIAKKRLSPELIRGLSASEDALRIALWNEARRQAGEPAAAGTALST